MGMGLIRPTPLRLASKLASLTAPPAGGEGLGGAMDDFDNQNEEISQLRREMIEHFNDLSDEMDRRDKWLINSIWNVVNGLTKLSLVVGLGLLVLLSGWTEWWQILIAAVAYVVISFWQVGKNSELELDDTDRIRRDRLASFGSWKAKKSNED